MQPEIGDPANLLIRLRGDLIVRPETAFGRDGYCIEDPISGRYFRLGKAEYLLAAQLDGTTWIEVAAAQVASMLGTQALQPAEAIAVCMWLVKGGLAIVVDAANDVSHDEGLARRSPSKHRSWLSFELFSINPDRLLQRLLPYFGWLFHPLAVACWALLWLVAVALALHSTKSFWDGSLLQPGRWLHLWCVWIVLKVLHESGHALACRRYGADVHRLGMCWMFFTPVAFVDVSAARRLASRWQRVLIASAGMYVELWVALLAAFVFAFSSQAWLTLLARDVVLVAGVYTVLVNANPLGRLDGYYILADTLGIPHLQALGRQCLACLFRGLVGDKHAPSLPASRGGAVVAATYALLASVWRVVIVVSIAAVLVSIHRFIGLEMAGLLAAFWCACLLGPGVIGALHGLRSIRPQPWRAWSLASAGISTVSMIVWWLWQPVHCAAPGVIEYSPPAVVRAQTTGFVRELFVHAGEEVIADQPLAQLFNDELQSKADELRCQIQACQRQEAIFTSQQDWARRQLEAVKREGLEKQMVELQEQLEGLVVKSPANGRLISRDWDNLQGTLLTQGAEAGTIGREDSKCLVIAIGAHDWHLFARQRSREVSVASRTGCPGDTSGVLVELQPVAARSLPYPSLAATYGGPVTVEGQASEESKEGVVEYRPQEPVFQGKVLLPCETAADYLVGSVCWAQFDSRETTIGEELYGSLKRILQERAFGQP